MEHILGVHIGAVPNVEHLRHRYAGVLDDGFRCRQYAGRLYSTSLR